MAAATRDASWHDELMRAHWKPIHAVLRRRISVTDDAEDLAQSTFLVAWAGLARRWHMRAMRRVGNKQGKLILSDRLWNRWMRAYARAAAAPTRPPASACPGCGRVGLRLEFTGGDDLLGFASMWCPTCLTGISTCRTAIPDDVPRLPWNMPVHQRAAIIGDYAAVLPSHNESTWRRWSRNIAAGLGLCMG